MFPWNVPKAARAQQTIWKNPSIEPSTVTQKIQALTSDQISSICLATVLLNRRHELDYRARSRILSKIDSFDFSSPQSITEAIRNAGMEAGVDLSDWKCPPPRMFRRMLQTAEEWSERGVRVISTENLAAPLALMHDLVPLLFAWGNLEILNQPATAILNSRKPRQVNPHDRWLRLTKLTIHSAIEKGFAIVSSYGQLTYCITSRLSKGSPTLVACDGVLPIMQPREQLQRFLTEYGDLFNTNTTLFLSPFPLGCVPQRAFRYKERDHLVGALASVVVVGEVSDHGNMRSVLDIVIQRGIPVEYANDQLPQRTDGSLDTHSGKGVHLERVSLTGRAGSSRRSSSKPCLGKAAIYNELPDQNPYLFHYTRSCPGPWPGQSWAEYCESLVENLPGAPHRGFDTLIRILQEKRIRGSRKLIRGAGSVVCFTECGPHELQKLVEWRKGLIRWSFEPYGLAFARESLFKLGARPSIYAIEEAFDDLSDELKHLFQFQRSHGKQWTAEKEWRMKGDLCFPDLDDRDIVVIVPTLREAEIALDCFKCKIVLAGIQVPNPT